MLCLSDFELYSRWVPLISVTFIMRRNRTCHSISIKEKGHKK